MWQALTILFLFLAVYYKINWHLGHMAIDKLQDENFKAWKNTQRYRRLLKSKKYQAEVTDLEIRQDDASIE